VEPATRVPAAVPKVDLCSTLVARDTNVRPSLGSSNLESLNSPTTWGTLVPGPPRTNGTSFSPMTDLEPGSLFGGYRIEAVAGRGGMGVVYKATQLGLDRTVALKLISPDVAHDGRFRDRFTRESRLAASIDHPNVIPVYEAGETDGSLFLSMRWVQGADLLTLIKRGGGLDPGQAARIVAQVGAALDAAHEHGLIHRDVKPANVLVVATRAEHVYLTDFGLVKRTKMSTKVTDSGEFVGTLDYIAPEQIEGKAEASSDVYSLGCVLFHSLTGRVPFERDSEVAKIAAHLNDSPPAPSEVTPGLPPQFDEVISRAMAKERSERYETAGRVGQAAVAAADSVSRPRPRGVTRGARTAVLGRGSPSQRALRRHPPAWAIAAGLVGAFGLAMGVLALTGAFDGGSESRSALTREGTVLKAQGNPGIYVVKAGAKFLTTPEEREAFFAGERPKIHLVSSATLDRIPNIPRDGARLKAYKLPIVWVVRDGHRTPVRPIDESGAVTVPRNGLDQVPLRPTGHQTTLTVRGPSRVKEDQNFRLAARARSPAGVPRGLCVFFRIDPEGLTSRARVEARRGRCSVTLRVTNLRRVRYSVHFYGYRSWRFPTASTGPIEVQPR
jgi:Protein kinase domain